MYCRLRGVHRGAGEATVTSSNTRVAGPLNYVEGHVKATGRYWGPMNHSYYSEGSIELRRGACKAIGGYWGPLNRSYYCEGSIELREGACKATFTTVAGPLNYVEGHVRLHLL